MPLSKLGTSGRSRGCVVVGTGFLTLAASERSDFEAFLDQSEERRFRLPIKDGILARVWAIRIVERCP